MNKILINGQEYLVKKNERDALDNAELDVKVTNYYKDFDYIVGDWAYGKLRLKGFNNKNNKNYRKINDYNNIDNYIANYCAYGCRWFLLEKVTTSLDK